MPRQTTYTPALTSQNFQLVGPRTAFVIAACAVLCTAHLLGAAWLTRASLGLPTGVWIMVIGLGIIEVARRRGVTDSWADVRVLPTMISLQRLAIPTRQHAVTRTAERSPANTDAFTNSLRTASLAFGSWAGRTIRGGSDTIRIGVDMHRADTEKLLAMAATFERGGLRVEWTRVEPERDEQTACAKHRLDAFIRRRADGELVIATHEAHGREAAWTDWAQRLPLSYAGVFPARVDPARVTLGNIATIDENNARLIARLAEAAAVLARTSGRLGVRDRLVGREPLGAGMLTPGCVESTILALAHALRRVGDELGAETLAENPIAKAAARVCSAWLTTWDGGVFLEERRCLVDAAARIIHDEPEAPLRQAASRFASYDDDAALLALERGHNILRELGETPITDPLAFVMAEIETGGGAEMVLGRVIAGVGLVFATAPSTSLEYLREDLIDDLSHCGTLLDREQDALLLRRVISRSYELRTGTRPMFNDNSEHNELNQHNNTAKLNDTSDRPAANAA